MQRKRFDISNIFSSSVIQILLIIWAIIQLFPIIWMCYSSLKTTTDINKNVWSLPLKPQFENYRIIWENPRLQPLLVYLKNSIIVTTVALVFMIFFAILASYAIAKFKFRGRNLFLITCLLVISIPIHSYIIPLYYFLDKLQLINNYFGLILPYIAIFTPFSIVILQSYFRSFPDELIDAARVDGCSEFGIIFRIIIPIAKGAISAVLLINYVFMWNEFLLALLILKRNIYQTITVGLYQFQGLWQVEWGPMLASLCFAFILPAIFYAIFSRNIIEGATLGAIKQ